VQNLLHAIFETGGKQYRAAEGDILYIEKLPVQAGDEVTFDKVLAIVDGDSYQFGTPVISGASVSASVVKTGKAKKIHIFKFKAKKNYRKRQGHRQPYTQVQIQAISVGS
jgi:large subunit ribosomal protein L21